MYLKEFKNGEIKNAILDICLYAAEANEVVEKEETEKIKDFCLEMGVDYREKTLLELGGALEVISSNCNESEKRKILMELIAIMMADGSCDDSEMGFLSKDIIPKLGITTDELKKFYGALRQYYMIVANMNSLAAGEC